MTTTNNVTVLWGLVHFEFGWHKIREQTPFLSFGCYYLLLLLRWPLSAERLFLISIDSPDEPPALQVLLDDLHGDPFLKADFILPLTGVRLYRHVFLLWRSRQRGEKWENVVIKQAYNEELNSCYSFHLPRGPYEGKCGVCDLLKVLQLFPYKHKHYPLVLHNTNNELPLLAGPVPLSAYFQSRLGLIQGSVQVFISFQREKLYS